MNQATLIKQLFQDTMAAKCFHRCKKQLKKFMNKNYFKATERKHLSEDGHMPQITEG